MRYEEAGDPYLEAMGRGFQLARELGCSCGPVHFLVGISEGDGPAAAALVAGHGPSLREAVATAGGISGPGGYLHMNAQEAARSLAQARSERPGAAHLLIALLDQGTPEVARALSRSGLDPAAVRRAALAAIGADADVPAITFPALTAAGTMDRPPLPIADLEAQTWSALRWRQDHLPLERVRRRSDGDALSHLEHNAAWRLVQRPGLDDDQRYSLIWHHAEQVAQRLAEARPDLADSHSAAGRPTAAMEMRFRPRRPRRPAVLNFTVGWGTWFRNRQVGLRDRWFRLRTIRYYRGAPQP